MAENGLTPKRTGQFRMGFDPGGLILFFLIMIPNFIWFAVPAPYDILRLDSAAENLDRIASVCQIIMIFALCFFVNKAWRRIRLSPLIIAAAFCVLLYYTAWIFYYQSVTEPVVILGLCVMSCLAFGCYAADRKNWLAEIPIFLFSVCHIIYGVAMIL